MTTEKRCATCAHWDAVPYIGTEGVCRRVLLAAPEAEPARVTCCCCGEKLITRGDFGCVLWEAK